jgi:hypothetical protein
MPETIPLPTKLHTHKQGDDSTYILMDNGEVWHYEKAELLGWVRAELTLENLISAVAEMQGQDCYKNTTPAEA